MQLPSSNYLINTRIGTYWFDDNGILCVKPKEISRKMEDFIETMQLYASLVKDKNRKLCLLIDGTRTVKYDKESRQYIAKELPKYVKAMALISKTPLKASVTNLFMKFVFLSYPVKVFNNEYEAKEWLKEFL